MNKSNLIPMTLNLQLFAEGAGGDGGTGAEGATGVSATAAVSQKGVKSNPLANVKYGVQPEETPPAAKVEESAPIVEDRNAKFEELIKGEYKDLYDARVQDTVQKRLKGSKETVEKYEALAPTLEMLAKKYGVDSSDIKALNKAIEDDDSYYEEEALEKGMSVQQLKEFHKIVKENAELKRMQEEQNAKQLYGKWMNEAEATKKVYQNFDFRAEMQNPEFLNLLRSNVSVQRAFEVIHYDEMMPAAMQYTAQQVAQKQANSIIANGARPTENGISSQGATLTKSDVSQLTKADRAEINRRVARGEKITFSR